MYNLSLVMSCIFKSFLKLLLQLKGGLSGYFKIFLRQAISISSLKVESWSHEASNGLLKDTLKTMKICVMLCFRIRHRSFGDMPDYLFDDCSKTGFFIYFTKHSITFGVISWEF